MVDIRNGVRIYHYRHGWIPLDHWAALKKAKGNHALAMKYLDRAHAAGHAHGSFADSGTHKAGTGGGSHLRRADGFQPVASEHLRRDKHVIAAYHPETDKFHLLDTQRGHTAVISREQAHQIHLDGHKIIGISKSESGGTQIKVQNMHNGQVHRIDAQRDHIHQVGPLSQRPGTAPKPQDATVKVRPEPVAPKPAKRNPFAEAGAREAQRKADALAMAKAEREREQAQRAAKPTIQQGHSAYQRGENEKAAQLFDKAGRPDLAQAARSRQAEAERIMRGKVATPGAKPVGLSPQEKIDNAAKMYGAGSPQHLAAQKRFAGPGEVKLGTAAAAHAGIVDGRAEREAAAARAKAKRAAMVEHKRMGERAQVEAADHRAAGNHAAAHEAMNRAAVHFDRAVMPFQAGQVRERAQKDLEPALADKAKVARRPFEGVRRPAAEAGAREAQRKADAVAFANAEKEREQAAAKKVAGDLGAIQTRNAREAGRQGDHTEAAKLYEAAGNQFSKAGEGEAARVARGMAEHHKGMAQIAAARPQVAADLAANQAAMDDRAMRHYARELQIKGNRLRNPANIQAHRDHVAATQNIREDHRAVLLKQIDRKMAKQGIAPVDNKPVPTVVKEHQDAIAGAKDAAGFAQVHADIQQAFEDGKLNTAQHSQLAGEAQFAEKTLQTREHFQNGGRIIAAPPEQLFDYMKANPDRFEIKGSKKNGQVSDTYKIRDKKTGEIVWRKDDGQARYGAVKEKLAADIGNAMGFFDHQAQMDVSDGERGGHVLIANAPGVQGFGERNRGQETKVGEAIRKGSDPASFMRMVMTDYLIANDEDRHYMNFHVVDEGGGRMHAAILDHGRAFGGVGGFDGYGHAPANADFSSWHQKYVRYSARGWDAHAVARAAYPQDHEASAAYDQIVGRMKQANVEDVIKQAFNAPGVNLPADKQAEWENLIRGRYAHLVDPKNKAGIIAAMKGA